MRTVKDPMDDLLLENSCDKISEKNPEVQRNFCNFL